MIKLYGLRNCDTCRKALKWLAAENVPHEFFDLRGDQPLSKSRVNQAMADVGAEKLINRRGTTWRRLDAADKNKSGAALITLVLAQPALMKRPVFFDAAGAFVGFDDNSRERLLAGRPLRHRVGPKLE